MKEIREAANMVRRRAHEAEDGKGKEKMERKENKGNQQTGPGEERRRRKARREEKRREWKISLLRGKIYSPVSS